MARLHTALPRQVGRNTCYIEAIIHTLVMARPFIIAIIETFDGQARAPQESAPLAATLLDYLENRDLAMAVARAKTVVEGIDNCLQQDAHEKLLAFLGKLEEEAATWREQQGIHALPPLFPIYSVVKVTDECANCQAQVTRTERLSAD